MTMPARRAAGVEVTVPPSRARVAPTALVIEDDPALHARLVSVKRSRERPDQIRLLGVTPDHVRLSAIDAGLAIDDRRFVAHPRIESRC
ncbi:MAG: hypothetical protein ACYC19_02955 [Acidimicrobiales bacterium]